LILPGLAAAAAVAPLKPGFPRPKREVSEELEARTFFGFIDKQEPSAKREPSPELEGWYRIGVPRPGS